MIKDLFSKHRQTFIPHIGLSIIGYAWSTYINLDLMGREIIYYLLEIVRGKEISKFYDNFSKIRNSKKIDVFLSTFILMVLFWLI